MAVSWNPFRGCTKYSAGCDNCYIHRADMKKGIDTTNIIQTEQFDLPIRKTKDGSYKIKSGTLVWTCFKTDFFHEKADSWRQDIWKMIKQRSDLDFFFITKRIDRFYEFLPSDWGDGYENVFISCTVENQVLCDYRLKIFSELPIKHKYLACQPLLEEINLLPYLNDSIELVVSGGESGVQGRICEYNWILKIREDCIKKNVSFEFRETGTYLKKDGKVFKINPFLQHKQAKEANINFYSTKQILNKL